MAIVTRRRKQRMSENEERAAFMARLQKAIPEKPREHYIDSGEPVECPFCALTPAAAFANNVSMPIAEMRGTTEHDVWITCDCMDRRPVNVREERLRREDIERRGKDGRFDGWRQAHWEDTQGRFNRDEFTPQSDNKNKREKVVVVDVRAEQEYQGWAEEDPVKLDRLQKLNRPVNVRMPPGVVSYLTEKARYLGTTVSDLMRRLMERHLVDLEGVPRLDKKRNKTRLHFCMTKHHQDLFIGRKRAEKCTTAELINAIVLRECAK